jgi:hypothetical protein
MVRRDLTLDERSRVTASKATCVLLATAAIAACSANSPRAVLSAFEDRFRYYECVPLGWAPVARGDGYYNGYSAEVDETSWWLPPTWSARMSARSLRTPDARVTYTLLNHLAAAGMIERVATGYGFAYHLTLSALPYYFDEDDYGNNPEHYSYLCYSRIVPDHVLWIQPIHRERIGQVSIESQVFRAAIQWSPGPIASWASDGFIRSHSVILPPQNIPIVMTFVNDNGVWDVNYPFDRLLPHLRFADAAAWPTDSDESDVRSQTLSRPR